LPVNKRDDKGVGGNEESSLNTPVRIDIVVVVVIVVGVIIASVVSSSSVK